MLVYNHINDRNQCERFNFRIVNGKYAINWLAGWLTTILKRKKNQMTTTLKPTHIHTHTSTNTYEPFMHARIVLCIQNTTYNNNENSVCLRNINCLRSSSHNTNINIYTHTTLAI